MNFKLYCEKEQELLTNKLIETVHEVLNWWIKNLNYGSIADSDWKGQCIDVSNNLADELNDAGIKADVLKIKNVDKVLGYGWGFHAVVKLPQRWYLDLTARQFGKDQIILGRY